MSGALSAWRRLSADKQACLALCGAWLLFFAPELFSASVPYYRDILNTTNPLREYVRQRVSAGQLPQWYPYELLGMPYSGGVVASLFHPQMLLLALFSTAVATKWSILLAYLFGLAGAYRLARLNGASRAGSVAGALVFACGGYAVSLNNNPPFLTPLCTAPWMLAAAQRLGSRDDLRDIALLALWWALVFLGGDPQLWLEGGLIAAGFALAARASKARAIGRFIHAAVLSAALASAEALPAVLLSGENFRRLWTPNHRLAYFWALHPLRWADFVLPHFLPQTATGVLARISGGPAELFAETLFIGGMAALCISLAVFLRTKALLPWIIVAVLGLWLAFGGYGGATELLWRGIPALAKFRYPEKYLALTALAGIPLVAQGVDAVAARPGLGARGAGISAAVCLAIGLMASASGLAAWGLHAAGVDGPLDAPSAQALGEAWSRGLIHTGLALLMLAVLLTATVRNPRAILLVPVLVFAELWAGNAARIRLASRASVEATGEMAHAARATVGDNQPPPRILSCNPSSGVPEAPPDDVLRVIHLCAHADDAGRAGIAPFEGNNPAIGWRTALTSVGLPPADRALALARSNVCLRVADAAAPPRADEHVLSSVPPWALVARACQPRAYLTGAEPIPPTDPDHVPDPLVLSSEHAVWEGGPLLRAGGGEVRWLAAAPERLSLEVDATVPSALVVTDAYASGWSATVDAASVPIFPTDYSVRGIVVPAGHHTVEMTYAAPGLRAGMALMAAGLGVCAGLFTFARRRRVRRISP